AEHPSTVILTAAALVDGRALVWAPALPEPPAVAWPEGFGDPRPVEVFAGPNLPAPLAEAIRQGRPLCAHNAPFDSAVWAATGAPSAAAWSGPVPDARASGRPGALDKVGLWLFGAGKDKAGKRLIAKYGAPKKGTFLPLTADDAAALFVYNLVDVLLLARL